MEEKRTFWIVAIVVALIAVAGGVAFFVTRYLRARDAEDLLDEYCDDDYDCDCGCCDEDEIPEADGAQA